MNTDKTNGVRNIRDTMMEICNAIEGAFNPLHILDGCDGSGPSSDIVIDPLVKNLRGELLPEYLKYEKRFHSLLAELDKELPGSKYVTIDGISDMQLNISVMEQRAWFAVGCLWGMKLAGKPMEEIRKLARSMR